MASGSVGHGHPFISHLRVRFGWFAQGWFRSAPGAMVGSARDLPFCHPSVVGYRVGWEDRPCGPHRPPNKLAPKLERQILSLWSKLREASDPGEYGAAVPMPRGEKALILKPS